MSAPIDTQPDPLEPSTDSNLDSQSQSKIDPIIDALFGATPPPVNDDLDLRVVVQLQDSQWQSTKISGLNICILEYLGGNSPRMTALFKLGNVVNLEVVAAEDGTNSEVTNKEAAYKEVAGEEVADQNTPAQAQIPANGLELLVQHGLVADDDTEYVHPFYIRQPTEHNGNNQNFTLYPGSNNKHKDQLEFYVATGQVLATDKQRRCINLNDHSLWLPGPVEHTEVMPLHMHEGNNSMLVRWLDSASFKPRLDPMGEEVLVVSGTLTDNYGSYSAGSWIRNPIAAWQAWGGESGTLIYYKNGHFDR